MFTERLNELIKDVCHMTTGEFARTTKYDRSYITHLRNGDRVPSPGLSASRRLSRAIYICAVEKNVVSELRDRVGASPELDENELCDTINAWLFEGQPVAASRTVVRKNGAASRRRTGDFGKKLNAVMELADISNLRLARAVNVDVSVISKYRSGVRVPRAKLPLLHDLSDVLVQRIYLLDRVAGFSRLIGVSAEKLTDEKEAMRLLEAWLRDFNTMDTSLIECFLDDIDNYSPDTTLPQLSLEKAAGKFADDNSPAYWGVNGLRRAVLRFLYDAVHDRKKQLLLYSDQNMEWMVANRDFAIRWMSLMSAYVSGGGRIQIIHNVDRGLEEMLAAIRSWLPLYISGGIESWYCLKQGGSRFFHTLFLEPEGACISGDYVSGSEKNARFSYITEKEELAYSRQFYQDLLSSCKPLFWLERMGAKPQLSVMRRDKVIHLVGNTLSLATMPEALIDRILDRAELSEPLRREIKSEWKTGNDLITEKVANGVVHECVPLPEEEALYLGKVPLDTSLAALFYTPEEYAEHVRSILELSDQSTGYRFYLLSEPPFQRIKIAAAEHTAMFGYATEGSINFITTHPLLCRSFVNFASRLEEQYDVDKLTLKNTLKRFT